LLSGQLLCRLKTVSPTLVGARQHKEKGDNIETIANYRSKGKIAIPGSSLRGVIGSVAEAISQSALRVLGQREFSVRKSMHESLMGIGMLRKTATDWRLLPLAITSLEIVKQNAEHRRNAALMSEKWRAVFPEELPMSECLAVHFGDYRKPANGLHTLDCFQAEDNARLAWSLQAASQPFRHCKAGDVVQFNPNAPSSPLTRNHGIAVRPVVEDVTWRKEQTRSPAQRGVCFVLGKRKKKDDEPDPMKNKYYEWFVPYAEDWEDRLRRYRSDGESTLSVHENIIKDFEFVAAERWREQGSGKPSGNSLPYLPKGYERSTPPRMPKTAEGELGFLRSGDLVYFDVDDSGREVTELSFSSIWRARVKGDLYGAFERTAGKDALPWSPKRDGLTPAERILGVVEDFPTGKNNENRAARNLASRVRFSDALGIDEPKLLDRVALRQLQSPKPPSPSMYFRAPDGGAVRKRPAEKSKQSEPPLPGLDLRKHIPNGRKHYLVHDTRKLQDHRPWESKKLDEALAKANTKDEKAQIERQFGIQGGRCGEPIAEDQEFWFHVGFDNLTTDELGLLCNAIDPRTSPLAGGVFHRNRIGWGKPTGLGIVRIDIDGLFLVDPQRRYSGAGLEEPRWHHSWVSERLTREQCAALSSRYPALFDMDKASGTKDLQIDSNLVDTQAFNVLIKLGDLQAVDDDVCYPYSERKHQQPYGEEDGFEWFSNNDQQPDQSYQHLRPAQTTDKTEQGESAEAHRLPWLKPQ